MIDRQRFGIGQPSLRRRVMGNLVAVLTVIAAGVGLALPTPTHADSPLPPDQNSPEVCREWGGTWTGSTCQHKSAATVQAGQSPTVDVNNCASVEAAIAYDNRQIGASVGDAATQQLFSANANALSRLRSTCGRGGSVGGSGGGGLAPPGTTQRYNQIIDNLTEGQNIAMNYLASQRAQQEAAQAQAEARAAQRRAEEDARRAQEAAMDAQRRAGLSNPFRDSGSANANANPFAAAPGSNPFASASNSPPVAAATSGNPFVVAPNGMAVPASDLPYYAASSAAPAAATNNPATAERDPLERTTPPPDRKLGDPKEADHLPAITQSACFAMIPRAQVIRFSKTQGFCAVEVDKPERTTEWHNLVDDPEPTTDPHAKFKVKPPVASGARG